MEEVNEKQVLGSSRSQQQHRDKITVNQKPPFHSLNCTKPKVLASVEVVGVVLVLVVVVVTVKYGS